MIKDWVQCMKVVKAYNNNAVSTIFPDQTEAVLIGSGIGFQKKEGDEVDEKKIEKIYYIQDEFQTKLLQLLKDARPETIKASEDILKHAKDCGLELKNQLILSLADHIGFALERYEQGIELPYLMMSETRLLYPKEYEIGRWALKRISELCGVELPEYEIGYIVLQLASGSVSSSAINRETAYSTLELVKDSLEIIKDTYDVEMDPDHLDTMRLTTHLKFLAQRIFNQTQWADDNMDGVHQLLILKHKKNKECIERLKAYIQETFSYTLNNQEETYLLVHLSKIFNKR